MLRYPLPIPTASAKKTTAKIAKKALKGAFYLKALKGAMPAGEVLAAAWCLLDSDTRSLVSWNYPPSHMPSAEE